MVDIIKSIIGPCITGTIIVVGWFVVWRLNRLKDLELRKLDHLKTQIEEYYGPICGIRRNCNTILFSTWKVIRPEDKQGNVDYHKLTQHDIETMRWVTINYWIPMNTKIVEIITTKAHLQQEESLPPIFKNYLETMSGNRLLLPFISHIKTIKA